jgi:heat shock protein HslJ
MSPRATSGKTIALVLVWAAPLLLASCGEDALGPTDVQGEWRLISLQRADLSTTVVPDPSRFTVRFEESGRVSLRADCNVCNGTYAVDGQDTVVSDALACTRAFCASAPLDGEFVAILQGRSTAQESGGRLVLASARGRLVFVR